jgi:hypothetical protein
VGSLPGQWQQRFRKGHPKREVSFHLRFKVRLWLLLYHSNTEQSTARKELFVRLTKPCTKLQGDEEKIVDNEWPTLYQYLCYIVSNI